MKLYVYEHCPYCVKAMMIFGLAKQLYQKVIIMEDDENTPISMVGRKVVPILEKDDGTFMPESMDIVHYVDRLGNSVITGNNSPIIAEWLAQHRATINKLLYPRFAGAPFPELNSDSARQRYVQRMTAKVGSFDNLFTMTPQLLEQLHNALIILNEHIVSNSAVNGQLSEDDFHLFASLRLLTLVKGIHFPDKVKAYVETMAKNSGVDLLYSMAL